MSIVVTPARETPAPVCHKLEPLLCLHMIRITRDELINFQQTEGVVAECKAEISSQL